MAMGILQALKLQEGSIDALAKLPQQQILALAQQGRIPADMVSTILNEKAEQAQALANMQAAQQPSPPSVTEANMALNAQAEAQPQQMAVDSGVASLSVPDDMYSMAGGGIVAFDKGGSTGGLGSTFYGTEQSQYEFPLTNEEKERAYAEELYRKNLEKIRDVFSGRVPLDRNLAERRIGADATRLLQAQDAARPPLPAGPAAVTPAARPAKPAVKPAAKPDAATATASGLMSIEDFKKQQKEFGIKEDPLAEVRAKIASLAGESKLDREHAKNMALLQAGLGMMSGTSRYALENIGKGAMAGVTQYGRDIKDIKAAERDLFKMQTELSKADDARARGDFKAFQEHNEKAKEYALKLRKVESDERQTAAYEKSVGRPTEEQLRQSMFRTDPEGFKKYQASMRPGFETAETQRIKAALEGINNTLLTGRVKKDSPEYKQLVAQRQQLMNMLNPSYNVPPNVQSIIDKYTSPRQ